MKSIIKASKDRLTYFEENQYQEKILKYLDTFLPGDLLGDLLAFLSGDILALEKEGTIN
jgi:hypothetical protein